MKSSKKTNKVLSIIGTIILIISFILVGIGLYQKFTGKELLPYKIVWVMTESMEDKIPENSYILIKKSDGTDIEKDDIITFYSSDPTLSGMLNTHRVIKINDDGTFVTKGDNNAVQDVYSVEKNNVVGKYICNLSLLTIFGRFFQTKFGLVLILLIIIIAFIIMSGIFKKKTIKQLKEEEFNRRVEEEIKRLEEEHKKELENKEK